MLPNPTPPTTDVYNLPELKSFRKELRKNLTPAEAKLWTALKNKQLQGRRFRRQYSVGKYIHDFYCPEEKLAVELDGAGHFSFAGSEYDVERDAFMQYYDVKVLRFENKLVWEDLEYVLEEIKKNFGWFSQNKIINQNQVNNQGSSPCKGEVSRSDGGVNSNSTPPTTTPPSEKGESQIFQNQTTPFKITPNQLHLNMEVLN
jgi:very-short-patch-repair endonuclease